MITSENVRGAISNLFQKGMSVAWVIRRHKTEVEYVNFIFFKQKNSIILVYKLVISRQKLRM